MTNSEEMKEKYHSLWFGLLRSIRYHSRRQGFYESCHSSVLLMAVLLSSGSATSIALDFGKNVGLILSLIITLVTAVSLVFRLNEKAWLHADFLRQFTELEIELRRGEANPTEELIQSVTDKRMLIEMKEPPVLKVLNIMAHNELLRAMGSPYKPIKVSFWQRIFADLFDFQEHKIRDNGLEKRQGYSS